jgi:chemotaxis protein MotB
LRIIGKSLKETPNPIRIEGHTDAVKYGNGETGYTNWELSTERANVARRELIAGGLDSNQVVQVIGFANTVPLNPEDLADPLNRRISITVLNKKPKQETKSVVRPVEKVPDSLPKGAQEIPPNLRAPAQFLSKDNAPKSPPMEIPLKVTPSSDKTAR